MISVDGEVSKVNFKFIEGDEVVGVLQPDGVLCYLLPLAQVLVLGLFVRKSEPLPATSRIAQKNV